MRQRAARRAPHLTQPTRAVGGSKTHNPWTREKRATVPPARCRPLAQRWHKPRAPPPIGRGRARAVARSAGPLRGSPRRPAPIASGPRQPASWRQRRWPTSGCVFRPRRPGSSSSQGAPRGSTSSASTGWNGREKDDRWYLLKWPSARATASIRGKMRERTDGRFAGLPLEAVVENLNPVLRGWARTSAAGTSGGSSTPSTTTSTSGHDAGQRKHGLHGWQWATRFTPGWVLSLGAYRFSGTVRPTTAYAGR